MLVSLVPTDVSGKRGLLCVPETLGHQEGLAWGDRSVRVGCPGAEEGTRDNTGRRKAGGSFLRDQNGSDFRPWSDRTLMERGFMISLGMLGPGYQDSQQGNELSTQVWHGIWGVVHI